MIEEAFPHWSFAFKINQSPDDTCASANDGVCDHGSPFCADNTDCTDCGTCGNDVSSVSCNNGYFGGDPVPGLPKQCICIVGVYTNRFPLPTPAPTIAPMPTPRPTRTPTITCPTSAHTYPAASTTCPPTEFGSPPAVTGCDGVDLMDVANIEATVTDNFRSGYPTGSVSRGTDGPGGAASVRFQDGGRFTLKDAECNCLQLGKRGGFTLTFWVKASGHSVIIGNKENWQHTYRGWTVNTEVFTPKQPKYGVAAGTEMVRLEMSTGHGQDYRLRRMTELDYYSAKSAPFKKDTWTHVAIIFRKGSDQYSTHLEFLINLDQKTTMGFGGSDGDLGSTPFGASAFPDIYEGERAGSSGRYPLTVGGTKTDQDPAKHLPVTISTFQVWDRYLREEEISALFFDKATESPAPFSTSTVVAAMTALANHISASSTLSVASLKTIRSDFVMHSVVIKSSSARMTQLLDLIDAYEASAYGPLFMTDTTRSGFRRGLTTAHPPYDTDTTELWLARCMWAVHQYAVDQIATAGVVQSGCAASLLTGRGWGTSRYFPGECPQPTVPTAPFVAKINTTNKKFWGRRYAYAEAPIRRPTGYYLAAGDVGTVTVPVALVDHEPPYYVLVGAHTRDQDMDMDKPTHDRLDRNFARYKITEAAVKLWNPLGGGVYIECPYMNDDGVVDVTLFNVVPAPFFSYKSFHTTTESEWENTQRLNLAPWADFESEYFMSQIPRNWIYSTTGAHWTAFFANATVSMRSAYESSGRPADTINRHVLYVQVDRVIGAPFFGLGYPQVNIGENRFPIADDRGGHADHWIVNMADGNYVEWHELGHAMLPLEFDGEGEAVAQIPFMYYAATELGWSSGTALARSRRRGCSAPATCVIDMSRDPGMSNDQAAIHWMISENFRGGREIDRGSADTNQVRYQERGYAKYADYADLFGWESFFKMELESHMVVEDARMTDPSFPKGDHDQLWPWFGFTHSDDNRNYRMSLVAGEDVTPLIHYWGYWPKNVALLRNRLAEAGIGPSPRVLALLRRRREMCPRNNAAFNAFFQEVYPAQSATATLSSVPSTNYGVGWFLKWRGAYGDAEGRQCQATIDKIIRLYFN